MLMRVAVGIHKDDIDYAIKTYLSMSLRLFTHASPTLLNAGTPTPQVRYICLPEECMLCVNEFLFENY